MKLNVTFSNLGAYAPKDTNWTTPGRNVSILMSVKIQTYALMEESVETSLAVFNAFALKDRHSMKPPKYAQMRTNARVRKIKLFNVKWGKQINMFVIKKWSTL